MQINMFQREEQVSKDESAAGNEENDNVNQNEKRPPPRTQTSNESRESSSSSIDKQSFATRTRQKKKNAMMEYVTPFRRGCGRIVNSTPVQFLIISLIAINAIMMGIATFDFVTENQSLGDKFELVDLIFLIVFTVELGLQFVYLGWRLFLDGWLVFDFIIITMSWCFSDVQIIRAFRIFRALRLVTRVKVMRDLVTAVFAVMPKMGAIFLLLSLIFYIFAVMMTQLFWDLDDDTLTWDYFGSLDKSIFTLFQVMTLDAWAAICREVQITYSWAWLPFILFVIVSGFVVVNLVIAVICEAISALHDDDKAKIYGNAAHDSKENDFCLEGGEDVVINERLETLEGKIEHLKRSQDQTMQTLECLIHYLKSRD